MIQVIVLFAAACLWLLIDRNNLSDQTKELEKKASVTQRQKELLDNKVKDLQTRVKELENDLNVALNTPPPAAPPPEKKTWLQERIEERGNVLESAPVRSYDYYPTPRVYSPNSRIIR